jgi:hypothetical protein
MRLTLRLVLIAAAVLLVFTIYRQLPPYAVYESLAQKERVSLAPLDKKYVLFKQLQGAGFNNQVSWTHCWYSQSNP